MAVLDLKDDQLDFVLTRSGISVIVSDLGETSSYSCRHAQQEGVWIKLGKRTTQLTSSRLRGELKYMDCSTVQYMNLSAI